MIEYYEPCLCTRYYWSVMLDGKLDPDTGLLYHGHRNPCGKLFQGHFQSNENINWLMQKELDEDQEYADWFCT